MMSGGAARFALFGLLSRYEHGTQRSHQADRITFPAPNISIGRHSIFRSCFVPEPDCRVICRVDLRSVLPRPSRFVEHRTRDSSQPAEIVM